MHISYLYYYSFTISMKKKEIVYFIFSRPTWIHPRQRTITRMALLSNLTIIEKSKITLFQRENGVQLNLIFSLISSAPAHNSPLITKRARVQNDRKLSA